MTFRIFRRIFYSSFATQTKRKSCTWTCTCTWIHHGKQKQREIGYLGKEEKPEKYLTLGVFIGKNLRVPSFLVRSELGYLPTNLMVRLRALVVNIFKCIPGWDRVGIFFHIFFSWATKLRGLFASRVWAHFWHFFGFFLIFYFMYYMRVF